MLLIVPYGIETSRLQHNSLHLRGLLIVPYGIETKRVRDFDRVELLLIVPYGIETGFVFLACLNQRIF